MKLYDLNVGTRLTSLRELSLLTTQQLVLNINLELIQFLGEVYNLEKLELLFPEKEIRSYLDHNGGNIWGIDLSGPIRIIDPDKSTYEQVLNNVFISYIFRSAKAVCQANSRIKNLGIKNIASWENIEKSILSWQTYNGIIKKAVEYTLGRT